MSDAFAILFGLWVKDMLDNVSPLPKSCIVSVINLLFLRKESYVLQCKRKCYSDSTAS